MKQIFHDNQPQQSVGFTDSINDREHPQGSNRPEWNPVEVIQEFYPIIRRMAAVLASRNPSSLDVEDLTSAGVIGLLGAMARYDPTREIKFRTFAEYRIRGMMLDEIRSMDWVPRSVRSRNEQIRQASTTFTGTEGRPPTRAEIAKYLGLSLEEVEASATRDTQLLSLDEPVGHDEDMSTIKDLLPDTAQLDPFYACLSFETAHTLDSAITGLSKRQREVVQMYYFSGLTMKEIGQKLGLTESGVCRIHAEALRRLRQELQDCPDFPTPSSE